MIYWDRVYKLQIGDQGETLTLDGTGENPAAIEFRVDVGTSQYLAFAQFNIHGLNADSRRKIYEQYSRVRFEAGFRERMGLVFDGAVYNVGVGRQGPDSYVTVFCRSAGPELGEAFVSKSWGPGTPMAEIVRYCCTTFGYPVQVYGDLDALPAVMYGKTISQDTKSALRNLGAEWGFSFIHHGSEVAIYMDNYTGGPKTQELYYSSETGLIGTPQVVSRGLDFDVHLDPTIQINDFITVENATATPVFSSINGVRYSDTIGKGRYRVQAITHQGSLYDGEWKTSIQGLNQRAGQPGSRTG